MSGSERAGDLGSPNGDLLDALGGAAKNSKRLAVDKLGYERGAGFKAENFMNSDEVGMIERRGCLSLTYQPFAGGRKQAATLPDELDGNHAAQFAVAR